MEYSPDYSGIKEFRKVTSEPEAESLAKGGWRLLAIGVNRKGDPDDPREFRDHFVYLLGTTTEHF